MPYELRTEGNRYCVAKQGGETLKCYDDKGKAVSYLRALYANVHESVDGFAQFSMTIVKANETNGVMRWRSVNSDVGKDLYDERMSKELFQDFIAHIDNEDPIPAPFDSVIAEPDWNGGMPYISLAHYKSGEKRVNVPGEPNKIYLDGDVLKSTGIFYDTPLGRAVFKSLQKDLVEKRDDKIRISIGFLDLEHSHGNVYTFTRKALTDKCPLCEKGVGDKIYKKGFLVHLALTRVPANPRTDMEVERAMTTKREDAESIIDDEEVIKTLDLKSLADDVLVVKAVPDGCDCAEGDQKCIDEWKKKHDQESASEDNGEMMEESAVVEEAARKDVSPADKKRAEKEYGDVAYADEANKKYPIDTEEHVRAALSYWGMPKNQDKYSPEEQKKIGGRIHAAAKKFGIDASEKKSLNEPVVVTVTPTSGENGTALDKSFETLKSRIVEIKSQGLKGDQALAEIQKDFDNLGETLKSELTPPASPEEVAAKTMETTLRSLLSEMLPQALAQAVAPIQSELESVKSQINGELRAKSLVTTPQKEEKVIQRSLTPTVVQKALIEKTAQKISQFDQIARQSVGLSN